MAYTHQVKLIRETYNGTVSLMITSGEAKRGCFDGRYVREKMRDRSGRVVGTQLREKYVAPSDAGESAATLTVEDMRALVGERGDQDRAIRKVKMWHKRPMCLWPAPKLRTA